MNLCNYYNALWVNSCFIVEEIQRCYTVFQDQINYLQAMAQSINSGLLAPETSSSAIAWSCLLNDKPTQTVDDFG